jgi:acetone carboxylase gamma subunit
MSAYTNEQIAHLVDGTLDWDTTFRMLSMPKDQQRFVQYLAALQEKVSFTDRIILPLGPHLYIVQSARTSAG